MKKILLASFLYEPEIGGGSAVVANQLARLLHRAGYAVTVLTTSPGRQITAQEDDGIKLIRLPVSNLYWVAEKDRQPAYKKIIWQLIDAWNPFIYRAARQVIQSETPDIFHSHKLRGLSPSIWSAAADCGVPKIIHTCHDYELLSPEGLFMGWAGKLAEKQHILMRPYQSLRRSISKRVHLVTAPSRYALDIHTRMRFFSSAQKEITPNSHGISQTLVEAYNQTCQAQKQPFRRFLYIGRLDKAKGIEVLCEAFLCFSKERPDVSLKIAGWGELEADLKRKYGNYPQIEFIGPVFGARKAEIFSQSDVLVAPSIVPETFGIVIAEAFAYGLPVIASKIGAYQDIVSQDETGWLIPAGSVSSLCDVMRKIFDLSYVSALQRNCFNESAKYSPEQFLQNYLLCYEN